MADAAHAYLPVHFALRSRVVSPINIPPVVTQLPGGISAQLLEVDDTSQTDPTEPTEWASQASSLAVTAKAYHRVYREGHLLSIVTGLCAALLSEIYTTTSGYCSPDVRKRLKYRSSPLSDFDVVRGSVVVDACDRFAYKRRSDGSYHGARTSISTSDFTRSTSARWSQVHHIVLDTVPVFFVDREFRDASAPLRTEHKRTSALRDSRPHQVALAAVDGLCMEELELVAGFIETVSGRRIPQEEVGAACTVLMEACEILQYVLEHRLWREYPNTPDRYLHTDPGEWDGWEEIPVPKRKKKRNKRDPRPGGTP
ncbi:uncharacterized protein PHACADRAFT_33165 [Phanerochaete carnosa HHB-10118-sp]|uniref:Uncharacterized protein n=1 Tax=Phanerochaete carnosa (strain HHB-10118-sp) TaxID=650164 RepID=K5VEI3_PHACS|nr:uncharacterized protein PHACADRAFT_33165 [Phanerochaete carnosa HHB-10118-sp]EKM49568.1 hypothetical protein PHACADRAFT_33165 [Phanerochaete carnosa HHB-10118-sp]